MREMGTNATQRVISQGERFEYYVIMFAANMLIKGHVQLYHDALCTLDNSVSGAMVSPSLMGSCGTIPLTVISVYIFLLNPNKIQC